VVGRNVTGYKDVVYNNIYGVAKVALDMCT